MIEDFPTRVSIWLALASYFVSVIAGRHKRLDAARWAWSFGCVLFLMHVAFAFHLHHDWSHVNAAETTQQRTLETTGIDSGIGIYANYLFTMIWIADVVYWWIAGNHRYQQRRKLSRVIHFLFIFMIVNGAIVFAKGPARWIGVAVILGLLVDGIYSRWKPRPVSGQSAG